MARMDAGDRRGGRAWAYAGAALGGAVSVAANVAHSFVPPAGAQPTWQPMPGAVLGAVFWPVALFVAIEILARTGWPEGLPWRVIRLGGLLPVAVVAAVVSYRHLSGLIRFYGEDGLTATVGPLAVDGLMIVASAAIIASATVSGGTSATVAEADATQPPGSAPSVAPNALPAQRVGAPDVVLPAPTAAIDGSEAVQNSQLQQAREFVLAELAAGRTPTGAAVGRRFGRNSRWGQRLVREVFATSAAPRHDPPDPPDRQSAAAAGDPLPTVSASPVRTSTTDDDQ